MIVFVHIPKTAGGTLRSIVRQWYGAGLAWIAPDEGYREPVTAKTTAVIGHGARLHGSTPDRVVAFVREPIERLLSHYAYWQQAPITKASPPLHRHVKDGCSFLEFATDPTMINLQTRYLAPFTDVELYRSGRGLFAQEVERLAVSLGKTVPVVEDVNVTKVVKHTVSEDELDLIRRINGVDRWLWERFEVIR